MKRILSILVLIAFLGTSSGYYLASHYCQDNFVGTQVNLTGNSEDPCCGDNTDCCDYEVIQVKVVDNYLPATGNVFNDRVLTDLMYATPAAEWAIFHKESIKHLWSNGPPRTAPVKAAGNLRC